MSSRLLLERCEHGPESSKEIVLNEEHVGGFTIFLSVFIVISLAFTLLRERLDKWMKDKKYLREVFSKLYEELTTLGMVSFLMFLLEQLNVLSSFIKLISPHTEEEAMKLVLESAHILLFVIVVIYILAVMCIYASGWLIASQWVKYELMSFDYLRTELARLDVMKKVMTRSEYWFGIRWWLGYRKLRSSHRFHMLRNKFIEKKWSSSGFSFCILFNEFTE